MLTRKHFKAIAQVINKHSEYVVDTIVDEDGIHSIMINQEALINELCIIFKQSNSLFNKDRFIDACKK